MYKALMVAAVGVGTLAIGMGTGRVLAGLRPQLTAPAVGVHKSAPSLPTVPAAPLPIGEQIALASNVSSAAQLAYRRVLKDPDIRAGQTAYDLTCYLQPSIVTTFLAEEADHRLEELTVDPDAAVGRKLCYAGVTFGVKRSKDGVYEGTFKMRPRNGIYVRYMTKEAILDGQYRKLCGAFAGVDQENLPNGVTNRFAFIGAVSIVK